jgi:protein-disulfide isomerase
MKSAEPAAIVSRDLEAGKKLGLVGTPALLVNGQRYRGAISVALLDTLIQNAITSGRR